MAFKYKLKIKSKRPIAKRTRFMRARPIARHELANQRKRKLKFCLFLIVFCIITIFLGWLFLFSPVFQIKEIKIVRAYNPLLISDQEIQDKLGYDLDQKILGFLSNRNLFLYQSQKVNQELSQDSRINNFEIKKKIPGKLIIHVYESCLQAKLLIKGDDRAYYLNSRGEIIDLSNLPLLYFTTLNKEVIEEGLERVDSENSGMENTDNNLNRVQIDQNRLKNLPIFYDQTSITVGSELYQSTMRNALILLQSDIFVREGIFVQSIEISDQKGVLGLKMTTNEGWYILIDSEADFSHQISNLSLILTEKIKDRTKLKYLDLRFGKRVYYWNLDK